MAKSSTTFKRGHKAMGGRPKGSLNERTIEIREFARHLIEGPAYQAGLRRRLIAGKAPQMEMLLVRYAYGQPVERHEESAAARAGGSNGPELRIDPGRGAHYERNLKIHGGEVTPEGREVLRRLMDGLRESVNKEGAKAKADELSARSATPPDQPA